MANAKSEEELNGPAGICANAGVLTLSHRVVTKLRE